MGQPLVSVIVPVYNGEHYLADALGSIFQQDYAPLQVIVVDDGSVDGTADIAKSYKEVQYIYQTNQGHGVAMNAGIKVAQGKFLAFLDADDLWTPNKLSVQIDYLLEHPDVGYVIARVQNFLEPDIQLPPQITKDLSLTDYAALSFGALVASKTVFDQVGDLDNRYEQANDVDWFIRAKEAGIHPTILPEILLHRRLHSSNQSYQISVKASEFLRVVKSSIDRKREKRDDAK